MAKVPKIALITSGLRRAAHLFPTLSGEPVGIINWNDQENTSATRLTNNELFCGLYAMLRRRRFANLSHLCTKHNLHYADIYKKDADALKHTLQNWQCNLVITANCSFVPTEALAHLSHGAINMHPSRLPDYRGAEPVLWQLAAEEPKLTTTIHRLSDQFDCGNIVAQASVERPAGASRDMLADITETQLGEQLLNEAISLLTKNPAHQGAIQPEKSATPYAHRKSAIEFGTQFPLSQFSPQAAWDLMHYFGHCPAPWLSKSGLQKKLVWRPTQLLYTSKRKDSDRHSSNDVGTHCNDWQIRRQGLTMQLVCSSAQILLKPRWR